MVTWLLPCRHQIHLASTLLIELGLEALHQVIQLPHLLSPSSHRKWGCPSLPEVVLFQVPIFVEGTAVLGGYQLPWPDAATPSQCDPLCEPPGKHFPTRGAILALSSEHLPNPCMCSRRQTTKACSIQSIHLIAGLLQHHTPPANKTCVNSTFLRTLLHCKRSWRIDPCPVRFRAQACLRPTLAPAPHGSGPFGEFGHRANTGVIRNSLSPKQPFPRRFRVASALFHRRGKTQQQKQFNITRAQKHL